MKKSGLLLALLLADAAAGRHCCCHGLQRFSSFRNGGAGWRCHLQSGAIGVLHRSAAVAAAAQSSLKAENTGAAQQNCFYRRNKMRYDAPPAAPCGRQMFF